MQLRTKVVSAAGIAAIVAAGGFAFTDSNTVPSSQLGYGVGTVTGANPTGVAYALDSGKTHLNTVTYTVPANPNYASQVATITVSKTGTSPISETFDCTSASTTITCDTSTTVSSWGEVPSAAVPIADVNSIALLVH